MAASDDRLLFVVRSFLSLFLLSAPLAPFIS